MTPINSGLREADMADHVHYLDAPLRELRQATKDHIRWHERRICEALNGLDTGLDLAWHTQQRDRLKRELAEMGGE